jgi:hypothetical protein
MVMMRITSSTATQSAAAFPAAPRQDGEGNLDWVARQLAADDAGLTAPVQPDDGSEGDAPTLVVLLGGRTPIAFRVRVAQSHSRHDLTPSHWSHAALLGPGDVADADLYEISLEPPAGFGFPTRDNGLQVGRLAAYDDPERYPNIAVVRAPVAVREWLEPTADVELSILERFRLQRSVLDATELVLEWLAFVWGVGAAGNPLLAGQGLPSAAMVEMVLSAARFDVTPGLESRASCPEAIWQAARWWHEYYADLDQDALRGCWNVDHRLADY